MPARLAVCLQFFFFLGANESSEVLGLGRRSRGNWPLSAATANGWGPTAGRRTGMGGSGGDPRVVWNDLIGGVNSYGSSCPPEPRLRDRVVSVYGDGLQVDPWPPSPSVTFFSSRCELLIGLAGN